MTNVQSEAHRSEGGLHRIADAHSLTPQFERVVQFALEDVRFTETGEFNTVGPEVCNRTSPASHRTAS